MTKYTPKYIETSFKNAASIRINQKNRGESKYANDAGYWDGGRCNWGANHNLAEDCQTLASFFTGIAELRDARKELINFNNQQEFEKNKQNLLTKTNEALNGLNMKTSSSTSIGGVCIIWADFEKHFSSILNDFCKEVERLKSDIERVPYNEAKELQKLLSDERKLKNEIEENERRARNEPDEAKRKQFIFLANEAKSKWKKLLERKSQLKSSRLGDDFNPDQHIDNFLKELEKKLAPKNKLPRTPHNPTNPNQPPTPTNPDNRNDTNFPPHNSHTNPNSPSNSKEKPFFERYFREILLIGGFLALFYYISNQKEESN